MLYLVKKDGVYSPLPRKAVGITVMCLTLTGKDTISFDDGVLLSARLRAYSV